MEQRLTPQEARAALDTVDRNRLSVIQEIDLPRWYFWGLAIGWIVLGFIADLQIAWLTTAATFAFGAIHSSIAGYATSGRHRTDRLSVRADVAGRQIAWIVIAGLVGLALLTIGLALALAADGAGHPTTIASVFVALLILLGGPQLLAWARHRAARASGL